MELRKTVKWCTGQNQNIGGRTVHALRWLTGLGMASGSSLFWACGVGAGAP